MQGLGRGWRAIERWPRQAFLVLAAACLLALVLAMPKRDGVNGCIHRIGIGLGLTLAGNCDSRHIASDARNIGRYLSEPSPSRSRPVYILALAAVTHVFSPLLMPLAGLLSPLKPWAGDLLAFYLGAILLNAAIVGASVGVVTRLVDGPADLATRTALIGLVASYDVTIAWFWVPHQIIMNLLAPLGAVLAFVWGMRGVLATPSTLIGLGLGCAAAALTYGYCLIWPVAFTLGFLWSGWQQGLRHPQHLIGRLLPFAAATCVPILAWTGTFSLAGQQVAYEAQSFGQFTWMGEAMARGTLLRDAFWRCWFVGLFVAHVLGPYGTAVVAATLGLTAWVASNLGPGRVFRDPVVAGTITATALMLVFNFLQGYHQARLLIFPVLLAEVAALRLLVLWNRGEAVAVVAGLLTAAQICLGFLGPPISME